MNDDAQSLARAIGARVRQERKSRGWTLDQLAMAAEVSRRMLVNVEQGGVNPSIGTLLRLADALGVGLPALVEPPERASSKLTRSGEGAVLWTGELGGAGVLVAVTEPPDVVELWEWSLEPGETHSSESHTEGTRELLQVQEGSVTLAVGDERHVLEAGDALSFRGDVAHAYSSPHDQAARFSLAVFEPGVGTRRKEVPDA